MKFSLLAVQIAIFVVCYSEALQLGWALQILLFENIVLACRDVILQVPPLLYQFDNSLGSHISLWLLHTSWRLTCAQTLPEYKTHSICMLNNNFYLCIHLLLTVSD